MFLINNYLNFNKNALFVIKIYKSNDLYIEFCENHNSRKFFYTERLGFSKEKESIFKIKIKNLHGKISNRMFQNLEEFKDNIKYKDFKNRVIVNTGRHSISKINKNTIITKSNNPVMIGLYCLIDIKGNSNNGNEEIDQEDLFEKLNDKVNLLIKNRDYFHKCF